MRRRILVFTGTRAEYGLLRNVIRLLAEKSDTALLASGTHLEEKYGRTLEEIEKDGFAPVIKAEISLRDNSPGGVCASMGTALGKFAAVMESYRPDLIVVLGDRYEALCAAIVAAMLRIPIAHIHGGEITEGAIDDSLRHAITKLSHLHFTACEKYRNRVIQLGEEPDRVWNVGGLGVENARHIPLQAEKVVRGYLDLPADAPYIVATYHPVTLEKGDPLKEISLLCHILAARQGIYTVFTGANADAGGDAINNFLRAYVKTHAKMRFFLSLGVERYINAARYSMGVVGNSSSGVCEIPGLGVPSLDIGNRQKGRERPSTVYHAAMDKSEIEERLDEMLAASGRIVDATQKMEKEYPTSQQIGEILLEYPLDKLEYKRFYDWESQL